MPAQCPHCEGDDLHTALDFMVAPTEGIHLCAIKGAEQVQQNVGELASVESGSAEIAPQKSPATTEAVPAITNIVTSEQKRYGAIRVVESAVIEAVY